MSENQWEYCSVYVTRGIQHKTGGVLGLGGTVQGWGYDCGISFISASGNVQKVDLTKASDITGLPFSKTIGLLGGAGWEMVNFQYGNMALAASGNNDINACLHTEWNTLSWGNAIAYFKRPVLPGRDVTEPKIVFS